MEIPLPLIACTYIYSSLPIAYILYILQMASYQRLHLLTYLSLFPFLLRFLGAKMTLLLLHTKSSQPFSG